MVIEERRTSLVAMRASSPVAVLAVAVAPGELVVRVGLAAPQTGPAVVALRTDPAAVEPQIGPVEAVLQTDQAAAELQIVPVAVLARGRRRARLAALARTKSVTALHHRDRVPVLAAEDLAAAAEITRAPAATEAIKA
jgi:hypothetical protein